EAKERLDVLNKSNDGFFIASEDLKARGIGDMLGIRQSGEMNFKMADIYEDADLLKPASRLADDVISRLNEEEAAKDPFIRKVYTRFKANMEKSFIDAL
ncbi:MAG: ATP-dependent DNA helicase RecG, partial [Lachnospiraceae bacterium]|nr:ATP-dependent DNA helicase RecG [Lachnospiraceae bacterium]